MKRTHNLKVVKRTLQDELDDAIAAEERLREQLATAQTDFDTKFPGDARLYHLKQQWEPEKIAFGNALTRLLLIRRDSEEAAQASEQARLRIAQATSEKEKRGMLGAAITAATETANALSVAEAAVARASGMVEKAQHKYEEATAAAQSACEQHARNAEEAARTGETLAASSLREARSTSADALDDLNAAKTALAKMQEPIAELKSVHKNAVANIGQLADDVLMCASVKQILCRARQHMNLLVEDRLVLRYFEETGIIKECEKDEVKDFLLERNLPGRHNDIEFQDWDDETATVEWRIAREALRLDPNAPLPSVGTAYGIR